MNKRTWSTLLIAAVSIFLATGAHAQIDEKKNNSDESLAIKSELITLQLKRLELLQNHRADAPEVGNIDQRLDVLRQQLKKETDRKSPAVKRRSENLSNSSTQNTQKLSESALPIRQVVLFSSGVGYFARESQVAGAQSVELSFRTEQINDVLKSLVVFDAGGSVRPITYAVQDGLARSLSGTGLNVDSATTLGGLLRQFQGARVRVETSREKFEGRVLSVSVQAVPLSKGGQIQNEVLNILTNKGMRAVALQSIVHVQLLDETLDKRLRENLELTADGLDNRRRKVTLNFGAGSTPGGNNARSVRAGYLLETPVWKTTYRLVLGDKATDAKPYLQGWAIAENTTDDDWKDVQLSLVAGRPISFIQNLYAPLYVPRPVVAPQIIGSPTPQLYGAALEELKAEAGADMPINAPAASAAMGPQGPPGPMGAAGGGGLMMDGKEMMARRKAPSESVSAAQLSQSVATQAQGGARGELFEYAIKEPVSIPRGQAALVPIVSETLAGEKISIFDASSSEDYALNGFRLKNSTGLHLQGGPITVFDGGIYAGDAQISDMAPDEERLISYAVDGALVVGREEPTDVQTLVSVSVRSGVLQLQNRQRLETVYTFRNKSKEDKTVLVQQPRDGDYELVEPKEAKETTDDEYRFEVMVPEGKTVSFKVAVEALVAEAVALTDMDFDLLVEYARNTRVSQGVREALQTLVAKRRKIVEWQNGIARLERESQEFLLEQKRIRDNMSSVREGTALHKRYLAKLEAQETQVENLQERLADARDNLAAAQRDLRSFVDTLTIEGDSKIGKAQKPVKNKMEKRDL